MSDVDFSNGTETKDWFEAQLPHIRSLIASRMALRVLANTIAYDRKDKSAVRLHCFRLLLIAAVSGSGDGNIAADFGPAHESKDASERKGTILIRIHSVGFDPEKEIMDYELISKSPAHLTARLAAFFSASAYEQYLSASEVTHLSARSLRKITSINAPEDHLGALRGYATAQQDVFKLAEGQALGALWNEREVPPAILANHQKFVHTLNETPDWSFWHDWYVAMWEGTFKDWGLAKEVAKIPSEFWEGEDALKNVAAEIEVIRAKFDLRKEVEALKSQLSHINAEQLSTLIGHNNPPLNASEEAASAQATVIIWGEIAALEREMTSQGPTADGVRDLLDRWTHLGQRINKLFMDIGYDHTKEVVRGVIFAASVAGSAALWPKIVASVELISKLIDNWLGYLILGL